MMGASPKGPTDLKRIAEMKRDEPLFIPSAKTKYDLRT